MQLFVLLFPLKLIEPLQLSTAYSKKDKTLFELIRFVKIEEYGLWK